MSHRPTRFEQHGLSSTNQNYEIELERMVDVNDEPFWMYYVYENGERYLIGGADTLKEAGQRAIDALELLADEQEEANDN